jgi:ferredoxin-NADP reductase
VYADGVLSKFLASMPVGESINVRGPYGQFTYRPSHFNRINMIACGSGITPMYPVLFAIAQNCYDHTATRLLYGNRSENDIALKRELDQVSLYLGDRLRITHALTEVCTTPPELLLWHTACSNQCCCGFLVVVRLANSSMERNTRTNCYQPDPVAML